MWHRFRPHRVFSESKGYFEAFSLHGKILLGEIVYSAGEDGLGRVYVEGSCLHWWVYVHSSGLYDMDDGRFSGFFAGLVIRFHASN